MRKIYSLVLMTAMLFVGANVNATLRLVTDGTGLAEAFNELNSGDTIRLNATGENPVITQSATINMNADKLLNLDMNGQSIVFNPADDNASPYNFKIQRGRLNVYGGGEIHNLAPFSKKYRDLVNDTTWNEAHTSYTIKVDTLYKYKNGANKQIIVFYLYGSTDYRDSAYTVLNIGAGTFVSADKGKSAITVEANSSCAYGVEVYVKGTCYGEKYGMQLSGNVNVCPGKGTVPESAKYPTYHFPYMYIMPGATVYAKSSVRNAVGAYAAGYGIWKIEGYVHGSTGLYIKGGEVAIKDAKIESTNNEGTGVNSSRSSGVDAGGNAIATESNGSYAGNIHVTISGDTEVKAGDNGYAIQDTVTTATETTLEAVKIEGGTFTGGTEGCIKIDVPEGEHVDIELTGGTFTGDVQTLIENIDDTNIITDVVSVDEQGNATVVIGKPEEGSTAPAISDTAAFDFSSVTASDIIKLTATATTGNLSYTLSGDGTTTEMQYLSLKADASKTITVTVEEGHTVKVGQIVMDDNAQIIVEAGAKLLVTNANGIFANTTDNLILHANANKQATFVISPDVSTNKQPKAKVEYYTIAKGANSAGEKWQRLTSPLSVFENMSHDYVAKGSPELVPGATSFRTWIQYIGEDNLWHNITAYSQMKAFTSYALTNNTVDGGITYTFSGNVQGNVDNNIELHTNGWNYMGNAFVAPMNVKKLLEAIMTDDKLDHSIYLWDVNGQKYKSSNKLKILTFGNESIVEIPALQSFIVKLTSDAPAVLDIDYRNTIYNYVLDPSSYSAPERAQNNYTSVRLHIESENGDADDVYVVEGEDFTAEYESGADAVKYMNEGMNFYVTDNENLSMIASNNVTGTIISLQTSEDINYTLTFDNVHGEIYALRDNLTNAVVLMNEGAIYNFTAQPNATLDGRFQIVSRQEMPTAVETIEETVAPKAIYTIMGQYVGETTDWNNLPAGVYVVDGVKVVK